MPHSITKYHLLQVEKSNIPKSEYCEPLLHLNQMLTAINYQRFLLKI